MAQAQAAMRNMSADQLRQQMDQVHTRQGIEGEVALVERNGKSEGEKGQDVVWVAKIVVWVAKL